MRVHLSVKSLAKTYALGILWFTVMLGSSVVFMGAVSDQLASSSSSISVAATLTAVVTVALAIVVATTVTGGAVVALRHLGQLRQEQPAHG